MMKVYTKTGDKGTTALIGGTRVEKYHPKIEAYGTVDELKSWIGLLRDMESNNTTSDLLYEILERLFVLESHLAADGPESLQRLPKMYEKDIELLEKTIDTWNEELPPLTHFVLPGGSVASSYAQIARTVCRRAERISIALNEQEEVPALCLKYLNRLSDFLFVYARVLVKAANKEEIKWIPRHEE